MGLSSFTCGYTPGVSCEGLAVQVTYSQNGTIYYSKTFTGSGTNVGGSGTAYLAAGTYNVVATGYPTIVPTGYSAEYSQGFATAYVA